MKILHISTILEWRGGDKQLITTINILKGYKDLEHYVLCAEGSVLAQKCKAENISYYTASRKTKFSLPFLKKIIEVVKKEKIDTIHVHDSNALSLATIAVKFLPKVQLVYSRKRDNRIKNNFLKRIKYNNPRITSILCNSQAVKNVMVPILNNPEEVKVIYDGVNVKESAKHNPSQILRNEFNIDADTLIIGNFAGLTRQKDIFTFLNAARLILDHSDRKIKFIIVGEGPLEAELKEYSSSICINSEVIFPGFRNDFHNILPELDIFMLSSQTEGIPLSVLEAFACRVPVVATAAGGTGEVVKNRITGMLSPVKDAAALAANALEVINNNALTERLKKNAFELASDKFTLEVMEQEYYNYYRNLNSSKDQ